MSVLRRPIRQIGYVVTDLDAALASWVELGVARPITSWHTGQRISTPAQASLTPKLCSGRSPFALCLLEYSFADK